MAVVIIPLMFGILTTTTFAVRQQQDSQRQRVYRGIDDYITANVQPGETVLGLLTPQCYPLFGQNLTTKVLCAIGPSESLAELFDAVRSGDRARFVGFLRANGIGFVAIGPLDDENVLVPEFSQVVRWLDDLDGRFTRVFGDDEENMLTLYRLDD
jgi:hypothetical protein